jgi:hypothetical protein
MSTFSWIFLLQRYSKMNGWERRGRKGETEKLSMISNDVQLQVAVCGGVIILCCVTLTEGED